MRVEEKRGRSPVPRVLMAVSVLAGLWFARTRLARDAIEHPRPDGARYLRDIAPMLRRVGCATAECHGRNGSPLYLSPALTDAADAVREYHAMRDMAPTLCERVTGHGHRAALREGTCEAEALRRWAEGRPASACQSGGPQRRVVR